MKKKSIFSFVLALCMLVPACFMLTACKKDNANEQKHEFVADWTYSETEHWHKCKDENCSEVSDKGEHQSDTWIVDAEATCLEDGQRHQECVICGYSFNRESIPHTGHNCGSDHICTICGGLEEGYVAKVSNVDAAAVAFTTFDEALTQLKDNGTLTLYADVTVKNGAEEGNYFEIGERTDKENKTIKTYTIDFGGHTLTSKKGGFDLYANLTLKNGKMVAEARNGIWVQNDAHLKIERDATVECIYNDVKDEGANYAVVATQGAVVDVYGTVHSVYGTALSGNGTSGLGGIVCNIHDGAVVKSDKNVAVYMPNSRELNFLGGTVTGTTAVYIKSGTTTISGGTFDATLETKADYLHNGNGCDATGDTIVIEACGYPGGNPVINITGGTFNKVAEGAVRVAYYTFEENEAVAINIAPSLGIEVNK